MIIFEAQYADIYDNDFIRTIEIDGTSFDQEYDVYMIAMSKALRLLGPTETLLVVRYRGGL